MFFSEVFQSGGGDRVDSYLLNVERVHRMTK